MEADRGLAAREHRPGRLLALSPASEFELRIARLDGEQLVLDGLGLALGFFRGDRTAVGENGYDSSAGRPPYGRIATDDLRTINRTARARSPHGAWAPILDRPLPWLAAIGCDLDLIETSDAQWRRSGADELVRNALSETIAARRGLAVATKMLHLKRPRLFPILDELVAVMLGKNVATDATPRRKLEIALELLVLLRREGQRNRAPLRRIQAALQDESVERSLVRILDAVLWLSHPAAGVRGVERVIRVGVSDPA